MSHVPGSRSDPNAITTRTRTRTCSTSPLTSAPRERLPAARTPSPPKAGAQSPEGPRGWKRLATLLRSSPSGPARSRAPSCGPLFPPPSCRPLGLFPRLRFPFMFFFFFILFSSETAPLPLVSRCRFPASAGRVSRPSEHRRVPVQRGLGCGTVWGRPCAVVGVVAAVLHPWRERGRDAQPLPGGFQIQFESPRIAVLV